MEKQQTAVEWLGLYIKGITTLNCDDIIKEAKKIEKQQIIDAWNDGYDSLASRYAKMYYNENFKK